MEVTVVQIQYLAQLPLLVEAVEDTTVLLA
jgi:hypothetical protein